MFKYFLVLICIFGVSLFLFTRTWASKSQKKEPVRQIQTSKNPNQLNPVLANQNSQVKPQTFHAKLPLGMGQTGGLNQTPKPPPKPKTRKVFLSYIDTGDELLILDPTTNQLIPQQFFDYPYKIRRKNNLYQIMATIPISDLPQPTETVEKKYSYKPPT